MEGLKSEAGNGKAEGPADRDTAPWPQWQFDNRSSYSGALNPVRRELSSTRKRLALLVADRSLLLARIEVLEHKLERVEKFAHHDELTGLPNRRLLEDRYALAIARSERQRDSVALLFIDIDRFKSFNDSFGHGVADRILQQLAVRLVACIRATDTACRFGGDEFVVLLSDCPGRASAEFMAIAIRERLQLPYAIDAQSLDLCVSIGAALYPMDGPELDQLLLAADADMYRAKAVAPKNGRSERDRLAANDAFTNEGAPPGETR